MNLDCEQITEKHLVNIHTKDFFYEQSLNTFEQQQKQNLYNKEQMKYLKTHRLSETNVVCLTFSLGKLIGWKPLKK